MNASRSPSPWPAALALALSAFVAGVPTATVAASDVAIGGCNPRVEVCEGPGSRAERDERRDDEGGRRARGWLSHVGCNPRVRVCER